MRVVLEAARARALTGLLFLLLPCLAIAHGSVVPDDDLCIINIGYLKAHFKIYLPQQYGHEQFCEDLPRSGESVFVMEYEHEQLSTAAIDFRIVRNVTGKGRFARLEDVEAIDDLDAVTVHYSRPAVVPDVYTKLHRFDGDGEYIGIVSARRADTGKVYAAVFPFRVGDTGLGYWPWIVAALVLLQLNYWLLRRRAGAAVALLVLLPVAIAQADDTGWIESANGAFRIAWQPEAPLAINRMHAWVLRVETADGEALRGAAISISGGMPAHDHGLPTRPRVLELDTPGDYRIAGLRFHMPGRWILRLDVDAGGSRDYVDIELSLP